MRWRRALGIVAVLGGVTGLALTASVGWLDRSAGNETPAAVVASPPASPEAAPLPPRRAPAAPAVPPAPRGDPTPAGQATATYTRPGRSPDLASLDRLVFGGRHGFREQLAALLEDGRSLPLHERKARAEKLRDEIARLEATRRILPPQALWLRAVVMQAEADGDEQAVKARIAAMASAAAAQREERRREAESRMAAATAAYRQARSVVVEEVMSSEFASDALRRQELRRRLQALRVEHFDKPRTKPGQ